MMSMCTYLLCLTQWSHPPRCLCCNAVGGHTQLQASRAVSATHTHARAYAHTFSAGMERKTSDGGREQSIRLKLQSSVILWERGRLSMTMSRKRWNEMRFVALWKTWSDHGEIKVGKSHRLRDQATPQDNIYHATIKKILYTNIFVWLMLQFKQFSC